MFQRLIKWFRGSRIAKLESQLAAARLQLFNAKMEIKSLSTEVTEAKNSKNFVGALPKEVYEKKVLDKIGYANLSSTESAEFKLGIQFALRHMEKEIVAG